MLKEYLNIWQHLISNWILFQAFGIQKENSLKRILSVLHTLYSFFFSSIFGKQVHLFLVSKLKIGSFLSLLFIFLSINYFAPLMQNKTNFLYQDGLSTPKF